MWISFDDKLNKISAIIYTENYATNKYIDIPIFNAKYTTYIEYIVKWVINNEEHTFQTLCYPSTVKPCSNGRCLLQAEMDQTDKT